MWHADLDPGTLSAIAVPAGPDEPGMLHPATIARWLTVVEGANGCEHVALSYKGHRVRLDVRGGGITGSEAVDLHFRMDGMGAAHSALLPLSRFLSFVRSGQFPAARKPNDSVVSRAVVLLRVQDAISQGASQREIGAALFGRTRTLKEWESSSDSLRSRVRRLVARATAMARGDYLGLLGGGRADRPGGQIP